MDNAEQRMQDAETAAEATAVLYLRVSTPSQVNTDYDPEGISIPAQREACLRKATQLDAQVVEEYIEPGKTATSMDKRPAFQAMLERIRTRRDVTYVIVYKLSRMNRNRLDDALVLASLRKYKATLVSATESIDQTPVGQLMHGILAAFNEYRSAEDGADIRYKMAEKARRGGTLGRAKLGYLNVRERYDGREIRTVTIDPDRGPFVTLAFELYATGNYSLERLADELTARGLRSRAGRYPAGPVSDSKLATMLRDRYYLGVITHDGAEYPGRHQPLVTEELFDRVQSILDASGTAGERRRSHDHHLKGSLYCARCHTRRQQRRRLVITQATGRHGGQYAYFMCTARRHGECDLPHLPIEYVEDAVTAYWTTQRLSPQFTADVRANLQTVLDETTISRRLLHDQLTRELAGIDRQEENLLDLAADATLPTSKVRTRLTRLQTRRQQIQHRLADTDDCLHEGAAVLHAQLDLLQHPDQLYRQLNDHGRRLLNQAIFDELLIDQDPDDQAIHIAGQTYTEAVRDLMTAAHEHSKQTNPTDPATSDRPATGGQTDPDTAAYLFQPFPQDRGWNKAAMVELRGFEPLTPSMRITGMTANERQYGGQSVGVRRGEPSTSGTAAVHRGCTSQQLPLR
jgi:site-specific DNA recombinase